MQQQHASRRINASQPPPAVLRRRRPLPLKSLSGLGHEAESPATGKNVRTARAGTTSTRTRLERTRFFWHIAYALGV